jgi:hypothetical protein
MSLIQGIKQLPKLSGYQAGVQRKDGEPIASRLNVQLPR